MAGGLSSSAFKNIPAEIDEAVEAAFHGLSPKLTIEEATQLVGRGAVETAAPTELMKLSRLWKSIDRVLGPGTSLLHALATAYPSLMSLMQRLERAYAFGAHFLATRSRSLRARAELNRLIREFEQLKPTLILDIEKNATRLSLRGEQKRVLEQSVEGYKRALDQLAATMKQQRDTLASLSNDTLASAKRVQRKKLIITEFRRRGAATAKAKATTAIGYALETLSRFGDIIELGNALRRRMANAMRGTKVEEIWHLIDPEGMFFSRALAVLAPARRDPAKWKLMRIAARDGIGSLAASERNVVKGYLFQLRGLLPEEASETLGALDAMGKKRVFEVIADLPPELAKNAEKMSVEHVKGPFWMEGENGMWVEFGDGATLLHDPAGGGAYLVLLGESKNYLPRKLFDQLFKRSDPRFAGQLAHYVDELGEVRSVVLKPLPGNSAPTYVFSRPQGMSPEEMKALDDIVESGMQSEREVWKFDLPFTRDQNYALVNMVLEHGVETLEKLGAAK